MLEQTLKDLGAKNLDVRLLYKNNLDGFIAMVTWHDPKHCYTLRTERLIRFQDLHAPIQFDVDNIFEFNLSNILGNMAIKVLDAARKKGYRDV